jgi:hypothetical protein
MISDAKVQALRDHLLNDRPGRRKPYSFHTNNRFRHCLLEEMEEAGLVEVIREGGSVVATRITPAGALCYLRAVGSSVGKRSGRDYFVEFVRQNPGFLDRCGPIQRVRVEKYLVLGFMPPFSKKSAPCGTQIKETQT